MNQPWIGSLSKETVYPRLHQYDFDNIKARPISGSIQVDKQFLSFLSEPISDTFESFSADCAFGALEVKAPFSMVNTTIDALKQK